MLSSAGYRVDTVLNGAAAVQAVAAQLYDAVLMDCQIIAMTAGARPEDRARCLAEGMDGYLAKPVRKDALLALVARSVNER